MAGNLSAHQRACSDIGLRCVDCDEVGYFIDNSELLYCHESGECYLIVNQTSEGKEMTVIFDKASLNSYSAGQPSAKWQVIYKTAEGLDYCREPYSGAFTKAEIETIVRKKLRVNCHVASAKIERW